MVKHVELCALSCSQSRCRRRPVQAAQMLGYKQLLQSWSQMWPTLPARHGQHRTQWLQPRCSSLARSIWRIRLQHLCAHWSGVCRRQNRRNRQAAALPRHLMNSSTMACRLPQLHTHCQLPSMLHVQPGCKR